MDKIGHFIMMSIVTMEIAIFLTIRKAVFIAFMIGIVIEYSQYFMPDRSASIDDVLANTAGILFAWSFWIIFRSERRNDG